MALKVVSVTTLAGVGCEVTIEEGFTVRDLKRCVKDQFGFRVETQSMLLEERCLVDTDLLSSVCADVSEETVPEITVISTGDEEIVSWIQRLRAATHYHVFREAPEHIQSVRDVVYVAVCGDGQVLDFVAKEYQHDREIVMAAVKRSPHIFESIASEFQADLGIALIAARQRGRLVQYAAAEIRSDPLLTSAAVESDPSALLCCPETSWDAELVMAALATNDARTTGLLARNPKVQSLLGQRDFIVAALQHDPLALRHASRALQADKELVLHAVRIRGIALQYAAAELQADADVVDAALAQDPKALQFAAPKFKGDHDRVLAAVRADPGAVKFASSHLRADSLFTAHLLAAERAAQRRASG